MGKGRSWELKIYNKISENTDGEVHAAISDYSGVAAASFCDVEVYHWSDEIDGIVGAFCELKKRKGKAGNRTIVMSGSSTDETGLEELKRLIDGTPSWGTAYVIINWTNRRPVIIEARVLYDALVNDDDVWETSAGPPYFDARLTNKDSISMRKPTLDKWHSAASSDEDWKVIADGIGVDTRFFDNLEMPV